MPDNEQFSEELMFAQGQAKLASQEEIDKETDPGYTAPNFHRRIDEDLADKLITETEKDHYTLTVQSLHSYRTTKHTTHDENSTTSEIP